MIEIRNRKTYIDLIKLAAIYMVLFNHTGTNGFCLFTVSQGSPFFGLYLFNAIFIKMGVPLFFMASGALLIGKEESLKQLIQKRFLKYLIVLIVASIIQYLYICFISDPQVLSVSKFLTLLYTSQLISAYWYLYAYLAFILMLPLLRRLAKAMTDKEYLWMVIMFGFISFLTILDFLIWKGEVVHNSNFLFFIQPSNTITYAYYPFYLFYSLVGYFIDQRLGERFFTWKLFIVLTIISFFSIVICCYMTVYRCEIIGEWTEGSCQFFFNTLIFIPTITFFFGARLLFVKHKPNEKVCAMISKWGDATFGIFLIENILRERTYPVFALLQPYIKTLPACWVWILFACIVGAIVTFILKRIPIVRQYI